MKTTDRPLSPEEQDEHYLDLLPDIEAEARAGYDDALLYHPWPHALDVKEKSLVIRQKLVDAGVPNVPGVFVTSVSAIEHDDSYLEFQRQFAQGTNTKPTAEALAIEKTDQRLLVMGVDKQTRHESTDPIWGTLLGQRCNTIGRYTLCMADLDNTSGDYETEFKAKTEAFRIESEWIQDKSIDPLTFAAGSLVVLTRYHFENLGVVKLLHQNPVYLNFYKQQAANLRRLGLEVVSSAGVVGEEAVSAFFHKMGSQVARICSRSDKAA